MVADSGGFAFSEQSFKSPINEMQMVHQISDKSDAVKNRVDRERGPSVGFRAADQESESRRDETLNCLLIGRGRTNTTCGETGPEPLHTAGVRKSLTAAV